MIPAFVWKDVFNYQNTDRYYFRRTRDRRVLCRNPHTGEYSWRPLSSSGPLPEYVSASSRQSLIPYTAATVGIAVVPATPSDVVAMYREMSLKGPPNRAAHYDVITSVIAQYPGNYKKVLRLMGRAVPNYRDVYENAIREYGAALRNL
jgi:hypothetical protein